MAKSAFLAQMFPLAYNICCLYSPATFKIRTQAEAALSCTHLHKSKMAAKNIYRLIFYYIPGSSGSRVHILSILCSNFTF